MTDRSGCGLVELTVLESLEALLAGRPRAHVKSARAVAAIETRIGLGPRYGYPVLVGLARPWTVAVRLVSGRGNFGDRSCDEPAGDGYTESRPSQVGQLVLDAEAGRLAPVPVGLINGTVYRGGTQPSLEPFGVIAALRRLLDDPRASDADLLTIVGPPYSVTGCELSGDLGALSAGRRTEIRETARITITAVPVPELPGPPVPAPAPAPPGRWVVTAGPPVGGGPPFAAHLVIESLPATVSTSAAAQAIASRAQSRRWQEAHPELARRAGLPIADVHDDSRHSGVRILLLLKPGSDPVAARDQLLAVEGIGSRATWAFPAPLTRLLRSWADQHRGEDLAASLARLEDAIRRDRAGDESAA